MSNLIRASALQLHSVLLRASRPTGREGASSPEPERSPDRGAISLEQVLWFVAVAVSVGVIATILWTRIFDAAEQADLDVPVAPGG